MPEKWKKKKRLNCFCASLPRFYFRPSQEHNDGRGNRTDSNRDGSQRTDRTGERRKIWYIRSHLYGARWGWRIANQSKRDKNWIEMFALNFMFSSRLWFQLFKNSTCPSYNETFSFWLNKKRTQRSLWFHLYHSGNVHTLIGKGFFFVRSPIPIYCFCVNIVSVNVFFMTDLTFPIFPIASRRKWIPNWWCEASNHHMALIVRFTAQQKRLGRVDVFIELLAHGRTFDRGRGQSTQFKTRWSATGFTAKCFR